nr:MAG TPA: Protein of unknown function (DUF551) [Caudoviricetes sp.]
MTDEKEDLERKAFEEWYARTYLPTPVHGRTFRKYSTGIYCLQHVQDAWQAWCAAKSRAEKSEWISVEDSMPEIGAMVLLCGKYENEVIIAYCATGYFDGITYREHWGADINGTAEVTHWQTLPEPPEQGETK